MPADALPARTVVIQDGATADADEDQTQWEVRSVEGTPHARFILHAATTEQAPPSGYKLLFVLPGGDGGKDFAAFVSRIHHVCPGRGWLVVQMLAPEDDPSENRIVWPTRHGASATQRPAIEDLVRAVLDRVKQDHRIDGSHVYSLSWSSGGPAGYALSLADDLPIAGTFVAMSVFKPDQLPDLKAARGKRYFILHSPQDFIAMRFPQSAAERLTAAGAEVKMQTYEGGHGWRGDVEANIRNALIFLSRR